MDAYRRLPETPVLNGLPDLSRAVDEGSAFLRQLIPFPTSGSVGPLSLLPGLSQVLPLPSNTLPGTPAGTGEPAVAAIVSQVASVLDGEMAKGAEAARTASRTATQPQSNAADPVLRQLHEVVDSFASLWPQLQTRAMPGPFAYQPPAGDAEPLATLRPRAAVKPGERATISMKLRNSESRPVRLAPVMTDLLSSRGGRIAGSLLELAPSEIALEPQEQKELLISATVPVDAPPGSYSGLLVVTGLDYLRALVTIEVAGSAGAPHTAHAPSPLQPAVSTAAPVLSPMTAGRHNAMMQEAAKLARDGELGNSDAIRLLQMPHGPEEVREVLARFDKQLTREAKSKLLLDAFVPLPAGVDNQRWEPIFDRYPISGNTHTTASGIVMPSELQYYNGEMVQLHGGCSNVAAVREALAGSGYKPMTLMEADGRESAILQFWSHHFSDTSLRPYAAMFVIVPAVPDATPASQACIRADQNGASSVLPMFDGRFDPGRRAYENKAHLYFIRLLDSTLAAIEVGRERMGTDKRPGTIELRHEGQQRMFSVRDAAGRGVAQIRFVPTEDPSAYLREVARAAATAGIPLHEFPAGTEFVNTAAARIGTGPVLKWQWRTDVVARFQAVQADTVAFDPASEEGDLLIKWGFEPKALAYFPNVRGVATGLAESRSARQAAVAM